jgi:chromosomal replication initiation ATPase DnaA
MLDKPIDLKLLVHTVAVAHHVFPDEIMGKSRNRKVCSARNDLYYQLYLLGWGYSQIGRRINRHHGTVIKGIQTHRKVNSK